MRLPFGLRDRPYVLLSLTSLFWAGNAVVGRAVVDTIPPVALAQIRWTAAFLILLPFALQSIRGDLAVIRRHIAILVLLSFCGITAFNTLLYWALQYTTAINATLMQATGPLLIGLFSLLIFREALTRRQLAGILVSMLGVVVVVAQGDPVKLLHLDLNVGDILVIVAVGIYGLYSILLRERPGLAPLTFLVVTIGLGALMLVPATVAEAIAGPRWGALTPDVWAILVYVTIFPSIVAYLAFNRGVQLIGANRAGPFLHLIPLYGAIMAVLFLGERPHLYHGLGALLIVGGVVAASRRPGGGNRVASERHPL
jgi:drug/metabolite transporter (DMT)-like permease